MHLCIRVHYSTVSMYIWWAVLSTMYFSILGLQRKITAQNMGWSWNFPLYAQRCWYFKAKAGVCFKSFSSTQFSLDLRWSLSHMRCWVGLPAYLHFHALTQPQLLASPNINDILAFVLAVSIALLLFLLFLHARLFNRKKLNKKKKRKEKIHHTHTCSILYGFLFSRIKCYDHDLKR